MWDARSGKLLLTLKRHGDLVRGVPLADVAGRPVVATESYDGAARVWDARSGELLLTLKGHGDLVVGVTLGEVDGQPVVASVGRDRTARVWDARTGQEQVVLSVVASVLGVALDKDRFAVGGDRGVMMIEHGDRDAGHPIGTTVQSVGIADLVDPAHSAPSVALREAGTVIGSD